MPRRRCGSFLAVYWATAMTSNINIGHRHILPTYPVMYILAGSAAAFWSQQASLCKTEEGREQGALYPAPVAD